MLPEKMPKWLGKQFAWCGLDHRWFCLIASRDLFAGYRLAAIDAFFGRCQTIGYRNFFDMGCAPGLAGAFISSA